MALPPSKLRCFLALPAWPAHNPTFCPPSSGRLLAALLCLLAAARLGFWASYTRVIKVYRSHEAGMADQCVGLTSLRTPFSGFLAPQVLATSVGFLSFGGDGGQKSSPAYIFLARIQFPLDFCTLPRPPGSFTFLAPPTHRTKHCSTSNLILKDAKHRLLSSSLTCSVPATLPHSPHTLTSCPSSLDFTITHLGLHSTLFYFIEGSRVYSKHTHVDNGCWTRKPWIL